jgi:hypothetical protein
MDEYAKPSRANNQVIPDRWRADQPPESLLQRPAHVCFPVGGEIVKARDLQSSFGSAA